MKKLLLLLIRVYQVALSPFIGRSCRFYPSCSHYAAEAIRVHGAAKGTALTAKRICKCNPWHAGGFDPVPPHGDARGGEAESQPGPKPAARPAFRSDTKPDGKSGIGSDANDRSSLRFSDFS